MDIDVVAICLSEARVFVATVYLEPYQKGLLPGLFNIGHETTKREQILSFSRLESGHAEYPNFSERYLPDPS